MAVRTSPESVSSGAARVTRVALRFPAVLTYRHVAIDLVSALVHQVEHTDRDFHNAVLTAFGEAFNNIVLHGYRGRHDGMLDVEAEMTADGITLRLIDDGQAVNFNDVQPPDLDSLPESGMGVFMIHALVDDVKYLGGPPNVLTLVKRTATISVEEAR
jgi:serine/threonine-protein kinase RsbW